MNIAIQEATVDLADSFRQTLDAVARERRYLLFLEAPPLEATRRFVAQVRANGGIQFFAVDAGRVVGWCDILRREPEGCRHAGHLGMGLLPEYRGRGLGTRLLTAALAAAPARGFTRIELEVFASNTTALALYRKTGFVEEGRKRQARFLDGVYDDFVLMARVRPAPGLAGGSPP